VIEAMRPYLTTHFGNPSSSHHYAEQPRRALASARQQVARLIGAAPDELVFTGNGSEADSLAIHGTISAHRPLTAVHPVRRARASDLRERSSSRFWSGRSATSARPSARSFGAFYGSTHITPI